MSQFETVNEVADAKANRKRRAAFYTPMPLVHSMVEWADVSEFTICLEPSGGDGRIVHALRQAGVGQVDVCEIETEMHERIRNAGGKIVGTDFLAYQPGSIYDRMLENRVGVRYDRIVMNPPFQRDSADCHLEHAWSLLRDHGMVICLATPMTGQRLRDGKLNMPGCEWATVEQLDKGLFKEFETNIPVVVIELGAGPYPPVDGFRNAATANAAQTIATCRELLSLVGKSRWNEAVRLAKREIYEGGASVLGIDWTEVKEHVTQVAKQSDFRLPTVQEKQP